jgi:hypothetical protein
MNARRRLLICGTVGLTATAWASLASAQSNYYTPVGPWCADYHNGTSDCSLPSYEMCQLGILHIPRLGWCYRNPAYRGPKSPRGPTRSEG